MCEGVVVVWWIAVCFIAVGLLLGVVIVSMVFAFDRSLVSLRQDQIIVHKPEKGFVLVSVPEEIAKKIALRPPSVSGTEARDMYLR